MNLRTRLPALILLALMAQPLAALADPAYSMTFLPSGSYAYAINNAGQITGAGGPSIDGHAFLWSNGTFGDIGALETSGTGLAISRNGMVTGYSVVGGVEHAFLYSGGTMHDICTLGGRDTFGNAINSSGTVAGQAADASGEDRAVLNTGAGFVDIGTLGGVYARAKGINDAGVVVGHSGLDPSQVDEGAHAFSYSNGVMTDLGTLGGHASYASAINDAGQITGSSFVDDSNVHAFLYSGGVMHDIGSFGGCCTDAFAINSAGAVVGYSSYAGPPGEEFSHAFLYSNGVMADLNTLVDRQDDLYTVVDATGINDSGQIAANVCTFFGDCRAVLLDPLSPVPEPKALALLLAGLVLLAVRVGTASP